MKILCTGDLHIGRRPSRLPQSVNAAEHACAEVWRAIVDAAISHAVDVVALSGDLVDQRNRFFEAVGPLERGLRRLADVGIHSVAVAGNHDHDVLPRLAELVGTERFHLVGRGGAWERVTIECRDGARLHVDGWSFPEERVRENPLASYALPSPSDGAPVLGLLHSDLGATTSYYAPVTLAELRQRGPAFWLLGHIHAWRLEEAEGRATVLYPGSPQAMDPGEPGCHGAWMLELMPGRAPSIRQLPLATVRYETVEVSLDRVTDADEIENRVVLAIRARMEEIEHELGPLNWLSCRLRLTGRTPLRREVDQRMKEIGALSLQRGGATACVEQVANELRPDLDLAEQAKGSDAPALLARLILALDSDALDPSQERLLRDACGRIATVELAKPYRTLGAFEKTEQFAREALQRSATQLLDELLAATEVA